MVVVCVYARRGWVGEITVTGAVVQCWAICVYASFITWSSKLSFLRLFQVFRSVGVLNHRMVSCLAVSVPRYPVSSSPDPLLPSRPVPYYFAFCFVRCA